MCGIAGAITQTPPSQERIDATIAVLANRGPDASGFTNRQLGDANLCLIHTRLAIIDLDEIVRCIDTCPVVDEIAEFDGKGLP